MAQQPDQHEEHPIKNEPQYGNPEYSEEEDIYTKGERVEPGNEEDKNASPLGQDLDVPGADLDNAEEEIGSEDEENNYYSIAGDNNENTDLFDPEDGETGSGDS